VATDVNDPVVQILAGQVQTNILLSHILYQLQHKEITEEARRDIYESVLKERIRLISFLKVKMDPPSS